MEKKTIWDLDRMSVEEFRRSERLPIILVLDNIRSLNNIGSMFRTADGLGIAGLMLCGVTGCPPSPEIHKTALGAEESVPFEYFSSTKEAIEELRQRGFEVCVLEQVKGSVSLDEFRISAGKGYAVIVGNEVDGVDPEVVDLSDVCLEIPQFGTKHSLNVSVSGALALWEISKQMRGK